MAGAKPAGVIMDSSGSWEKAEERNERKEDTYMYMYIIIIYMQWTCCLGCAVLLCFVVCLTLLALFWYKYMCIYTVYSLIIHEGIYMYLYMYMYMYVF